MTKTVRINVYFMNSTTPIEMGIQVPIDANKEEYIDSILDSILSEDHKYNCEWEFI